MFAAFSEQFYKRCLEQDFELRGRGTGERRFSEMVCWSMQKMDKAALCLLHVVDAARVDFNYLQQFREKEMADLKAHPAQLRSVFVLYLLVSAAGEKRYGSLTVLADGSSALQSFIAEAEPYFSQPIYCVYWRVFTRDKTITTLPGQPDELFGLRKSVKEALDSAAAPSADTASDTAYATGAPYSHSLTYNEAAKQVADASPYIEHNVKPVLVYVIMAVNIVIMGWMYLYGYGSAPTATAVNFGAIFPDGIFNHGEYYRLFTAMFIHFGVSHLLANTVGLFIFGTRVERIFGRVPFLLIYLLTGLCASVASLFLTRSVAAGASGAINGLIGAIFMYTKVTRKSVDGLNNYIMLLFIGFGFALGFLMPNVDQFGHFGGLAAGLPLGYILTKIACKRKEHSDVE